jgi:hypothetical protein
MVTRLPPSQKETSGNIGHAPPQAALDIVEMGFARNRGQVRKAGNFPKDGLLCYLRHGLYLKIASPTHEMTQKGKKMKKCG